MNKSIGKITEAYCGYGGYQDAMIGFSFCLETKDGCCGDFWGTWSMEPSKYAKWSKKDQIRHLGESMMKLNQVLSDAQVSKIEDLVGIPIEVTWDGNIRKSWRVLTECIINT